MESGKLGEVASGFHVSRFSVPARCAKSAEGLLVQFVLVLELFYAAGGVYDLFAAGEERMACVADIDTHFGLVGKHGKVVATGTTDMALDVFGVNSLFHWTVPCV